MVRIAIVPVIVGLLFLVWMERPQTPQGLLARLVLSLLVALTLPLVLSDAPFRERLNRAFLIVTSVALVFFALEILVLAGILNGQRIFATAYTDVPWLPQNRSDPELLFTRKPNQSLFVAKSKGNIAHLWCLSTFHSRVSFTIKYDENGFRNKPGLSQADIVVIGDSYVEAIEFPKGDTVTSRLSEDIEGPVANLGLGGYGPQQQLIALKRYGLPLQPKVIFWFFYEGNDLEDALSYERRIAGEATEEGALTSFWPRSVIRNAVKKLYSFWCQPHPDSNYRYGNLEISQGRKARMYFWDGVEPFDKTKEHALDVLTDTFEHANQLIQPSGARLIVVFVPTKYRVYHDLVKFPDESRLLAPSNNSFNLPERVGKIVNSLSPEVLYFDLTPHMKSRASAGAQLLYLLDDTHWTVEGHRFVAEKLYSFLAESRLITSPQH